MKGIPFRLEDWLSTPEEQMAYAEALHEDLARVAKKRAGASAPAMGLMKALPRLASREGRV